MNTHLAKISAAAHRVRVSIFLAVKPITVMKSLTQCDEALAFNLRHQRERDAMSSALEDK